VRKTPQVKNAFRIAVLKKLLERGLTVTAFAKALGYARNTVSMEINRRRTFPGVREAIRRELGV
jgi:predicted transcriptional regulator